MHTGLKELPGKIERIGTNLSVPITIDQVRAVSFSRPGRHENHRDPTTVPQLEAVA